MKYKRIAGAAFAIVFAALAITLPMGAWAEGDDVVQTDTETSSEVVIDPVSVKTFAEFEAALLNGGEIVVGEDIIQDDYALIFSKDTTVDLNGHTVSVSTNQGYLTSPANIAYYLNEGVTVTVKDSSEAKTGEMRYAHTGNTSPETVHVSANAKFILESGTIYTPNGKSGQGMGVKLPTDATFEMRGGAILGGSYESTNNYGVNMTGVGNTIISGGKIETSAAAVWAKTAKSNFAITGGELVSTKANAIAISAATVTGMVDGAKLSGATTQTLTGVVTLKNVNFDGGLNIAGGNVTLNNVKVEGVTTISGGNTIVDEGTELNGGVVYQVAATSSILTINDGVKVKDFAQIGKAATANYKSIANNNEKVVADYNTYGHLVITGGEFAGNFQTVSTAEVEQANAGRKTYLDGYNTDSTNGLKNPIAYADVAVMPEISGGKFATQPDVNAVVEGKDVYDLGLDGPYVVDDATTVSLPEGAVYVKLGDTMDLGGYLTDVAKKYGTFGVAEDAATTIDGETLVATAAKAGTATISFKLHNYKNKVDKTFDVVVYTTGSEDQANEEGSAVEGENEESLAEVSANVMGTVLEDLSKFDNASAQAPVALTLEDGTKIAVTANTAAIKTALQNGERVLARLQVSEFVDDHLTGAENALIEGAMSSNAKKFGTVEYRILLETATTMIGEITELPESDTMLITFDVTAEPELAENYRRAYQVIRLHENEAPAVLAATYDSKNHTVSFASNKFSSFTLAYVDTQIATPADNADDTDNTNKTTNADTPETGTFTGGEASVSEANVVAIVVALIAIVAVVASAVKFAKSRE